MKSITTGTEWWGEKRREIDNSSQWCKEVKKKIKRREESSNAKRTSFTFRGRKT